MPGPTLGSEVTEAEKTESLLCRGYNLGGGGKGLVAEGWRNRVGGSLLFGVLQVSVR